MHFANTRPDQARIEQLAHRLGQADSTISYKSVCTIISLMASAARTLNDSECDQIRRIVQNHFGCQTSTVTDLIRTVYPTFA